MMRSFFIVRFHHRRLLQLLPTSTLRSHRRIRTRITTTVCLSHSRTHYQYSHHNGSSKVSRWRPPRPEGHLRTDLRCHHFARERRCRPKRRCLWSRRSFSVDFVGGTPPHPRMNEYKTMETRNG